MQQPLYLVGEIDLRRKDAPETSRAIIINKMFIPGIKYLTVSHNPGGGVGAIDAILPRIEALEPKAEIKGEDKDLRSVMGQPVHWTFAVSMRDMKANKWLKYRGEIVGAIAEWEPDEMSAEEFKGFNLVWKEVSHLEVTMENEELLYYDFWERELRPDPQFAAAKRALGA